MQIHQLVLSRRRSLALVITAEAKLVVRAPRRLPEKDIYIFIEQKRSWIEKKIAEVSTRPKPKQLSGNEQKSYYQLAKKVIPERVKYYSDLTGLKPKAVKISRARKRWGSCGAKGTINVSWRLALVPQEVMDYVVVHELAHLVERNHGKRFWQRVAEISPNYRACRKWLRRHGSIIS